MEQPTNQNFDDNDGLWKYSIRIRKAQGLQKVSVVMDNRASGRVFVRTEVFHRLGIAVSKRWV